MKFKQNCLYLRMKDLKPHQHVGIYFPQCDKPINNMNKDLEKARRDYPIGTKIKSMFKDLEYTLTGECILCNNGIQSINQNGLYCYIYDKVQNKWAKIINEILEKARRDYPIGTKVKSLYKSNDYVVTKPIFIRYENVYTFDENGDIRCLYDIALNKWAEIIKEETMTQQEFNALRVGNFISNYEILHKYKDFLIVRCEDGHDLFDLNKINKLGLKVTPKTFMGLEIKKYDNVPCEINDNSMVYLVEVMSDSVIIITWKNGNPNMYVPKSIRIL